MLARWLLATLHLLALGIGLGAVWARARTLAGPLDPPAYRRVFTADSWWGLAGLLWISTGLVRAFGGFEKGTDYYLGNHFFLGKMGLLVVLLLLELWPMTTLIRWRFAARKGAPINPAPARTLARLSYLQALLVVGMVLFATAMARGMSEGR
jgi:putative membrane protein